MKFGHDDNISYLLRKIPFMIILIMVFILIVVVRLYYLQILEGQRYEKLAEETFVREEEIVAKRGSVTDRFGKVLAKTRTYYEIVITPQYIEDKNKSSEERKKEKEKVLDSLVSLLPLDKEDIKKKLFEARYEARFQPVVIVEDAPYEWVAKLREHMISDYGNDAVFSLRGVDVRDLPVREYLYPEMFSHVLGYLTEIDKEGLKKAKKDFPGIYSLKDLIGAAGIEDAYELSLKGRDGVLARVVDARGREVTTDEDLNILRQKSMVKPIPGDKLKTSLVFEAQKAAYDAFMELGKKGTAVALDPHTGEVLVLLSVPGYDANRITKNVDKDYWKKINLDEDKYLYNRAVQGMYPPASTYKVIALAAGIDTKAIDPDKFKVGCPGGMRYGNRFFKCWTSHGTMNTLHGLSRSCDTFFYKVGLLLGVDKLAEYAKKFGLGSLTGIEIPFEKAGLVPTSEWKERRYKQKWFESETLSVSIGQSYNLVTPLQNAVSASLIANGGYRVVPHIGLEIISPKNEVISKVETKKIKTSLVGSKALEWVKKGMIEVVHGYGTAGRLKQSPNKIAGKTGTAQVIGHGTVMKDREKSIPHGLFIAFAPYDDPKIAVSVVVEHGRGGSATAAPVAMKIIDAYFKSVEEHKTKEEQIK